MCKGKSESDSEFECALNQEEVENQEEVYQKPKRQMKYEKGANNGKWNSHERLMYFIFLSFIVRKECLIKGKKMNMIFKMMSEYMQTRNLLQCRSHHQKMCQKYGNLTNILKKGKKQLDMDEYEKLESASIEQRESIFAQHKDKLVRKSRTGPKKNKRSEEKSESKEEEDKFLNRNTFSEQLKQDLKNKEDLNIQEREQKGGEVKLEEKQSVSIGKNTYGSYSPQLTIPYINPNFAYLWNFMRLNNQEIWNTSFL